MSATAGYSHAQVGRQYQHQTDDQSIGSSYRQLLGMYKGGEPFSMASHHHHSKPFAYEPLPMAGDPGARHAVSGEMETLMMAMSHNSQRHGEAASKSKKAQAGGKRSRDELNRREQQRVQLMNDRIYDIREQLEDAGIKVKKTKQSVLDSVVSYIQGLKGDLFIAQQKAELTESVVAHAQKTTSPDSDRAFERYFQRSATPRLITDMNMKPLAINAAFVEHAGSDTKHLMKKTVVCKYLTTEKGRLEIILKTIREKMKPFAVSTTASSSEGDVRVLLTASPVCDDKGSPVKVEFSVLPLDATPNDGLASRG